MSAGTNFAFVPHTRRRQTRRERAIPKRKARHTESQSAAGDRGFLKKVAARTKRKKRGKRRTPPTARSSRWALVWTLAAFHSQYAQLRHIAMQFPLISAREEKGWRSGGRRYEGRAPDGVTRSRSLTAVRKKRDRVRDDRQGWTMRTLPVETGLPWAALRSFGHPHRMASG